MDIKAFIAQKYEEWNQKPFPFTNFLPLFHFLQDNQNLEYVRTCLDYTKTKEIEGSKQFATPTWLMNDKWNKFKNINPAIQNFGIVSSNFHQTIQTVLEKFHVQDQFQYIIGRDDVLKLKPFPEGLFKCIEYFKTSTERCIFIGDMPSDEEAAQKANIQYFDISKLKKVLKFD